MTKALPTELVPVVVGLEADSSPLRDIDVSAAIHGICDVHWPKDTEMPSPWLAECIAFDFFPEHSHEYTKWGTYYGPQSIFPAEGGAYIHPNISQITPEIIEYWKQRFQEAKHPILRLRYADLVWDFSPKVCKKGGGVEAARTVIDTTIRIAEQCLTKHAIDGIKKLKRAFSISLSIRDQERQNQLITTIINYEKNHADNEKAGTWVFPFDMFMGESKVNLTPEQEQEVIKALEGRLTWAVTVPDGEKYPRDHFAANKAAERLGRYYASTQRDADKVRVLRMYAQAVLASSRRTTSMVACSWLRTAYDLMLKFGLSEEADRLVITMSERGATAKDEMTCISHTMQVPTDEIEQFLNDLTKGDENDAAAQIAVDFIPDPIEVEKQVKELAQKTVLTSLVPLTFIDESGRNVATVGSVEDDLAGRVVKQIADNMIIDSMFLGFALNRWVEHYHVTPEKLVTRLLRSPLFKPEQEALLLRGVQAYFNKDDMVVAHLLVPQIEAAIRQLFVIGGKNIYRPSRNGGLDLDTLGNLLRDTSLEKVLGVKSPKYLQVLLVDPRGWNIRNNVCHGMIQFNGNNRILSDRLIHVLLLLSFIQKTEKNNPVSSSSS
ncbi:MAG: DUF4209 domain-containing protein [Lentisphaeria bacterium]